MMRAIWNTLSFLAVVHLLALLMLVGWLWNSGRLNSDRVTKLRDMLSKTPAEEQAQIEKDEAAKKEADRQAQEDAERNSPSVQSADQVRLMNMIQDREAMAMRRLSDEKAMLMAQIGTAEDAVKKKDEELAANRAAWDQVTAEDRARQTDAQFQQTVKAYESIPAKQAKSMFEELIRQGQMEQAVAYLDAMNPRAASKVLKEFKTPEEIQLATKLLEDLRRFGTVSQPTQEMQNAAGNQPTGS
ncbi:MAG TPA: hypothetical protein VG711_02055 [Phycisphaerales bacterium]|nr:hypothetical protein [Phycisphaerales bacterium]